MTKPSAKTTWVGVVIGCLTLATAYLGNDKYQSSQIVVEATDVTVAITSLPAGVMRSNSDINAMIKTLVDAKMKAHIQDSGRH